MSINLEGLNSRSSKVKELNWTKISKRDQF